MEFERGMENKIEKRKERFYEKDSRSEQSELQEPHVFVVGQQNETHIKGADHNITVEIKNEPGLFMNGETPFSDTDSENETSSVFSYSENVLESDETEVITKVEIKEEPWWLERTTEVKYDRDNSPFDAVEQNEIQVERNEFITREKTVNSSPGTQQRSKSLTASSKRRRKQGADKREQGRVDKRLSAILSIEEKDEWSVFGQFIASELHTLRQAPKFQIKLKNLIQKSIIEVTSEYAEKFSNAVPAVYSDK